MDSFSRQTTHINSLHVYTCGGTGGWRRVVYLDMTDPNTNCPAGWKPLTHNSTRTCGRATDGWGSCDSVFFPVSGGPYSQVCGRVKAYQWGFTGGFVGYIHFGQSTIDSGYVSCLALTHGNPRHKIWKFAAGRWENPQSTSIDVCPCDTTENIRTPQFVSNDLFRESGHVHGDTTPHGFFSGDLLWDGKDCKHMLFSQ